ncbi:MAG: hypothetical protein J0H88_16570 [Sphingomonadales bacterium]|nr:hypothetical protein [Sphingomonadales bacterium]
MMGLFDFFRRTVNRSSKRHAELSKMSRIEYLLHLRHDRLEALNETFGGKNYLQLVEDQLKEGNVDLAIWNIANQVKGCFELANLYWGQGNLARADTYLHKTLERHDRLVAACAERGVQRPSYDGIECAKCAACLLDIKVEDFARMETFEPCYEPWFKDKLLSYCLDSRDFDDGVWRTSAIAWTKRRHPKYRLEEFSVYAKALTGGYGSTEEMLSAHEKMFAGRVKRSPDAGLLEGYADNELIIDYVFAAILKRIGWEGAYRHSWPNTDVVNSIARTTRHPDRYLGVIAAPEPEPDANTGIIEDAKAARRFIDIHLQTQRDDEGKPSDATRPGKQRGKVARALSDLGWPQDPATLDLMQSYRMDLVQNDRTHISLCDPVDASSNKLGIWTKVMSDDFGLHPDFIAIAGSEERHDYLDPQGAWYVYWKKDGKIYAVDRDEWDKPEVATTNAQAGVDLWPSYVSFVAWWVSEHLKSHA